MHIQKIERPLIDLGSDDSKAVQWRAFLRKSGLTAPADFIEVTAAIREFLLIQLGMSS